MLPPPRPPIDLLSHRSSARRNRAYDADTVVAPVRDVNRARGIDSHSVWIAELCCRGRAAISEESSGAVTGNRDDGLRRGADLSHAISVRFADVEVPGRIHGDAVRRTKAGAGRRESFAGGGEWTAACHRGDDLRHRVDFSDQAGA